MLSTRSKRIFVSVGLSLVVCSCGGSATGTETIDLTGTWSSPTGSVAGSFSSELQLSLVEASGGVLSGTWSGQGTTCAGGPLGTGTCFWSGSITGSHSGNQVSLTLQNGRTTFDGMVDGLNRFSGSAQARDSGGNPFAPSAIVFVR